MFSVESHVGRLLETRITSPFITLDDIERTWTEARVIVERLPSIVACADLRAVKIFRPEVAERFVDMLSIISPKLERSAVIVLREHATAFLQNERMIKLAGSSKRRNFRDVEEARAWLAEVLTPAEKKRLDVFLSVPAPPPIL